MDQYPRIGADRVQQAPTDWGHIQQAGMTFMRLMTGGLGVLMVLVGVFLAMSVFNLVRGMIEAPDTLGGYLDKWASAIETPAPPDQEKLTPEAVPDEPPAPEVPPTAEALPPATPPPSTSGDAPAGPDGNQPSGAPAKDAAAPPPLPDQTKKPVLPPGKAAGLGKLAPARSVHPPPRPQADADWLKLYDKLIDAIGRGHLARPIGAFFVLLLTLVLVRIPFAFLKAGTSLLLSLLKQAHATPPPLHR